jgi:hypothetical protein
MEWAEEVVLPEGKAGFVIEAAKEEASKKGNSYLSLRLRVTSEEGECSTVFHNEFARNIKKLLISIGQDVEGQTSGEFDPADLVGESGRCRIGIEEYEGKTRNKVVEWLPPLPGILTRREQDKDDIPF